ncbi:conjugal transfer protein TrbE [Acidithiobacillus sp. CV18-2]|nr:conjugal transfer protein TrbE [Acidithiobacillus sp. CV18-3]MBU2757490.1 conjugal transfer protein TrbE [Acidithiobacillus sp. BN09-2]MBU2777228.1 conjugal transfer protein TrbE [Acidithiobacillus sp. CV18-2]MBU2799922.1 conjugal transfer protein TrbE [Acidithiobacillus sp. VAN18-4]
MLNIKEFRAQDLALPDLLNPAILAGEISLLGKRCAVLLNKDGSFLASLRFAGPDLESLSYAATNRVSAIFNAALSRLGSGWTVQNSAIRIPADGYIEEDRLFFSDPVSALIDAERRLQFAAEGQHFLSRYYLDFTWQTPPESEVSAGQMFVESKKDIQRDSFDMLLKKFEDSLASVTGLLRQQFLLSPLDAKGLLTHYHECLTGRIHGVNPPTIPVYLDVLLGHHDFVGGLEPSMDGEPIEVVTVTGYPDRTRPELLEELHNLPFPLRYTTRFIVQDQMESKKLVAQYREKWASSKYSLKDYLSAAMDKGQVRQDRADQYKAALEQETVLADADVSSGAVRLGYFTATIVLRAASARVLEDRARIVMNLLGNAGFVAKRETVNVVEAFLGSLPGHTWENVRRPVLSSLNFVDLSPKTAVWAGDEDCPSPLMKLNGRKAPCLTYAKTSGSTPFRFNFHVSDVGHSLILGPTGAGKSSLLGLIAAQWLRYPKARIVSFDKGRSLFALTEAVGGQHYDLGGEYGKLSFAPLAHVDQPSDRVVSEEWLESLAVLQGVAVTARERAILHQAVEGLAQEQGRSITDMVSLLQDERLKQALGVYTGTGKYADLLDAREDGLDLSSRFVTFEMDSLPQGDAARGIVVPILLYLFHRIETLLDGSPTLIVLDEAWTLIDNPLFLAKIREWLKVLRKKNAVVVFATQSLADLIGSPLLPVLQESCPTKIFLPNIEAGSATLLPMYSAFGLADKQVEILQTATPKQDYYISSPLGQRLVSFAMGPVALAFCAVSDPRDVKRVAELRDQHGPTWPVQWLQERLPADIRDGWVQHLERQCGTSS